MTRAADANTTGTFDPTKIDFGSYELVIAGNTNANSGWIVNSKPVTLGADPINWAQFSGGTGVSSLGGLTGNVACGTGLNCASATASAVVLNNYLGGFVLSNDIATPNSVLDVAAGMAADSTNATYIPLGAFSKSTAGAWVAGAGNHGMGNGLTVAVSTWYNVCLANNGGTSDVWFDTSATCANRPSGISDSKFVASARSRPMRQRTSSLQSSRRLFLS